MDRSGTVLCCAVFHKKVVDGLRNFCCPVKPSGNVHYFTSLVKLVYVPDANHEGVTFTSLELCDAANVERLVWSLALDENRVPNFIFHGLVESVVLVTPVSQVLPRLISPGLPDAVLLRPHYRLPDVLLFDSFRQWAETLPKFLLLVISTISYARSTIPQTDQRRSLMCHPHPSSWVMCYHMMPGSHSPIFVGL